jgi:hypothetical protein
MGCHEGLPELATEELLQDDAFLQKFHHALLEASLKQSLSYGYCLEHTIFLTILATLAFPIILMCP